MPLSWLGRELEIASRLGISFGDEAKWLLGHLMPEQRFFSQNWEDLIAEDLKGMIGSSSLDGRCLLVSNFDIIISSLTAAERSLFWDFLHQIYRPPCGVLLTLPMKTRLMSEKELSVWSNTGRLAIWQEGATEL